MRWLIALVFTCLALFGAPALAETTVPKSQSQVQLSFAPVVKMTAPAVVNVYSKTLVTQDPQLGLFNDPFFRQFFGDNGNFGRPRQQVENSRLWAARVRSSAFRRSFAYALAFRQKYLRKRGTPNAIVPLPEP